jgi:uncharacterized protein (DUF924 family)
VPRVADSEALLSFWFGTAARDPEACAERKQVWFAGDAAFDRSLAEHFGDAAAAAARDELVDWTRSPREGLALVLLLDQLPRNFHRESSEAFARDEQARAAAHACLEDGFDRELHPVEAAFLGLPFEHAEDMSDQERSVAFFSALVPRADRAYRQIFQEFLAFAEAHREVIRRFGRFPHRNSLLGRSSTPEERRFLEEHGRGFA